MAGVNKCIFVGNLGRDPEVRHTSGGMAVATLNVAVGERVKKGNEYVEHTEWVRCSVFGKTAENAAEYLQKGRQVYVEGKLRQKKYTDKDGVEKYSTEVVVDVLQYLGKKGDGGGGGRAAAEPEGDVAFVDDGDSLPF